MQTEFSLKKSLRTRLSLTKKQEKAIVDMYSQVSQDISEEIQKLSELNNTSSILRTKYLEKLQNQINANLQDNGTKLNKLVSDGIRQMSTAVVEDNKKWLTSLGFNMSAAWSNVPSEVLKSLATGQVYEGKWTLSKSIWKDIAKNQNDINMIIAKGVAENKSTYEIAKALEQYVNPNAAKPWDWGKVYPGTNKVIDYNAQRLARTMVQHAYQQSFVRTTFKNPWITKYQWEASSAHPCPLCKDRDGQLYNKWELPLDHPNGMCNVIPVIEKSDEEIIDDLTNWVNSPEGTYPSIDDFAASL